MQKQKFKLSSWDKFKLVFSLLFVVYGWYYYLSYPNPKSLDELKTCIGKIISLDMYQGRGVTRPFLKVNLNNQNIDEFGLNGLNSSYGLKISGEASYYMGENVYSNKIFMQNSQLLRDKNVKIWYADLPIFSNAKKRAYQIQILDFSNDTNPNLKKLEYLVNFYTNSYLDKPFNVFLLISIHCLFLIIFIKILIKSRRTKCQ